MAVHFFHTSDWHLGQLFHNYSRHLEHEKFLTWLLQEIGDKQPHALLIAGDIFDIVNPSSASQKQLYQFLANAHDIAPHMQTLMIAGNHDSGYRIEQVEPLLAKYNAKAVGIIQWTQDKKLNLDHLILPIYNSDHVIVAWCVALPFLRPAEITGFNEHTQDNQSAISYLHQTLIDEAKRRKTDEQALIVMSHAHMQGGQESDSERCIVIGHQDALSTDLFSEDVDYVALGHLHKPQKVGNEYIRYSGAPIPLSFSELNYKHQVLNVHIHPNKNISEKNQYEKLIIPRSIALHAIKGELQDVFKKLEQLPDEGALPIDEREFVDIEYYSHTPPPLNLRQQIEDVLPKQRYRITRIVRKPVTRADTDDSSISKIDLAPPTPENLFEQIWDSMGYQQDTQVKEDFLTLLHEAEEIQHKNTTSNEG
ncbi:exonuclease subunit SbcD [Acinetobacter nectaris]|uniref:exonuclease subunit SbcD n=1 Tax=Acinetobacter nectaris TaxID=1219382 RepID=UPI001F0150C9|nr:exonuclease subunit SbcD [Acinetobacter nectaris]MCF9033321.1 exonuclease SbcCD subunit D C-terminal domain-containing protein [Acinetobacter nectaris]